MYVYDTVRKTNESVNLERELVERVDLLEVIQDEVEEGGPGSRWPIVLSRFIYLLLCEQCLCYLEVHTQHEYKYC